MASESMPVTAWRPQDTWPGRRWRRPSNPARRRCGSRRPPGGFPEAFHQVAEDPLAIPHRHLIQGVEDPEAGVPVGLTSGDLLLLDPLTLGYELIMFLHSLFKGLGQEALLGLIAPVRMVA